MHKSCQASKKLAALAVDAILRPAGPGLDLAANSAATGLAAFVSAKPSPARPRQSAGGLFHAPPPALQVLHNDILDPDLVQKLHDLYLTLFTVEDDKAFRRQFALEFVHAYPRMNVRWTMGVGTQNESLFGLAVQLLTVPSLLPILDREGDVIGTLLKSLRDMLIFTATDPTVPAAPNQLAGPLNLKHHCITHSRYRHVVQDVVHVLRCNEEMPRIFVTRPALFGYWCETLALVQGIGKETRRVGTHIEYEDDSWVHAFELSWSLTQLSHDIVSSVLCSVDTIESDQTRAETIQVLGRECISQLTKWIDLQEDVVVSERDGQPYTDAYNVSNQPVTFHLPLTRLVAIAIRRCCASSRVNAGVDPTHFLHEVTASRMLQWIEHPLRAVVFSAQVQVGLWRRNGSAVANEAINYSGTNNRVLMADLDLTLLQIGAAVLVSDTFLSVLLDRFGISPWVNGAAALNGATQLGLAEECFSSLIAIVSELPRHPSVPITSELRRELIHRLCAVGDSGCSHSRLAECAKLARRQGMAEKDHMYFTAAEIDAEIRAVAEYKEAADPMQPGRYELRDEMVGCYDPYFSHLTRNEHEEAREWLEGLRKKARDMSTPRPCVVCPDLAHPFFDRVRAVLHCPRMAGVWRAALDGAVDAPESTQRKSVTTDGITDAALQLMTLAVHFCADADDAAALSKNMLAESDGECLLLLLQKLQIQFVEGNANASEAAAWILHELARKNDGCREKLGIDFSNTSAADDAQDARAKRKQEAQRRAMASMQTMQSSFLSNLDDDSDTSDDDASEDREDAMVVSTPEVASTAEQSVAAQLEELPNCALSREGSRRDHIVGLLAFAQRSCLLTDDPAHNFVFISFYGHAVHFEQCDTYFASLYEKRENGESYEGMYSINLERGEFLSPVCKSICNLVVPAVIGGPSIGRGQRAAASATAQNPAGVVEWLRSGFAAAFLTGGLDGADGEVADIGHVGRMGERLYDISGCPSGQRTEASMLREIAHSIAYTIEATDAHWARHKDHALWEAVQLRELRNFFEASRKYAENGTATPLDQQAELSTSRTDVACSRILSANAQTLDWSVFARPDAPHELLDRNVFHLLVGCALHVHSRADMANLARCTRLPPFPVQCAVFSHLRFTKVATISLRHCAGPQVLLSGAAGKSCSRGRGGRARQWRWRGRRRRVPGHRREGAGLRESQCGAVPCVARGRPRRLPAVHAASHCVSGPGGLPAGRRPRGAARWSCWWDGLGAG